MRTVCFFSIFFCFAAALCASMCLEARGGALLEHMNRSRQGGSHQSGDLCGSQFSLERVPPKGVYLSFLYRYEEGHLYGMTGGGMQLVSLKRDRTYEGALGYTLSLKSCFTVTPFIGKGRLIAKNAFKEPSPIVPCYDVRYNYFFTGTRFDWRMKTDLTTSIVVKGIFSHGAHCRITDPEEEEVLLQVEDKPSWEVEIPFTYSPKRFKGRLRIGVIPFYRYRHWGGHSNYPYDFFDTRFYILGGVLNGSYCF